MTVLSLCVQFDHSQCFMISSGVHGQVSRKKPCSSRHNSCIWEYENITVKISIHEVCRAQWWFLSSNAAKQQKANRNKSVTVTSNLLKILSQYTSKQFRINADTSHSKNQTCDDVNVFESIAIGRHDDFLYNRCWIASISRIRKLWSWIDFVNENGQKTSWVLWTTPVTFDWFYLYSENVFVTTKVPQQT